jgi:Tfp pilus assembly protein PilF
MEQRIFRVTVGVTAVAALAACGLLSRVQVGYWKDSETLYHHALNVTRNNWLVHNNLGMALKSRRQYEQAVEHFRAALQCEPNYLDARINLGFVLAAMGKYKEASQQLREALRIKPDSAETRNNLGVALMMNGATNEAIAQFTEALRIRPDFAEAADNLRAARDLERDPAKSSRVRIDAVK